jgi:large subunit ribosomal protein L15
MQTHDLKRATPNQSKKRVGRGGTRGKTSGKGHKGQGQHGSSNGRPAFRDLIKKLPKLRGHGVNRAQTVNDSVVKPFPVNVQTLEVFESNALVSPQTLEEKGIVSRSGGRLPKVKILGDGELTKKLTVISCQVSASAKEKIEAAGGKVKA